MSKKVDTNDLADLSEAFIDEGSQKLLSRFLSETMPELASELPIAKTFVVVGKLFDSARQYHRTKNLLAFLSALRDGDKSMDEFEKLPGKEKNTIRGLVISQLDLHSDERQAEALGFAADAFLSRKIDRITFIGIVSEIKGTNPLLYYAGIGVIRTHHDDLSKEIIIAEGPTHLLPAAFGHNTVTGIGQWGSTGDYKFTITRLGQAFLEHVYDPILRRHSAQ